MIEENEYLNFMQEKGYGNKSYAVKIQIYGSDLDSDDIKKSKKLRYVGYEAIDKIKKEINRIMRDKDPETEKEITRNKKLLECFDGPIYVEEIPNGYCQDWCCEHKPWFKVTTKIGHFVIGWRKRVINLDWSETQVSHCSKNLFPDNDQSDSTCSVHVDTYEQARKYIKKIIDSI